MKLSDFNSRQNFIHYLHVIHFIDHRNYVHNGSNEINISSLLNNSDSLYSTFSIPKKYSNGKRQIDAPNENLKGLQEIIRRLILNQLKANKFEFGKYDQAYQVGKGIFTNAQIHRNKKYLLHIDIKDFFPSIHFGRVSGYFQNKRFSLNKPMACFFADLCCYKGVLPQGAPTSPIIANLIGEKLDIRLLRISKKYRFVYSRYADDLTFSTNESINIKTKIENFKKLIEQEIIKSGFSINQSKTHLEIPNARHTVTGLSNNKRVSSNINFYKNTRAMANSFYVKNSFFVGNENHSGYTSKQLKKSLAVLEGRYAFIVDIENKNEHLYAKHRGGAEYHSITPTDFDERHFVLENNKTKFAYFNSGKKMAYSKFLFFKYFLSGEIMTVFTEGKTDPLYLKAAMRALGVNNPINMIDLTFKIRKTQFKRLFSLSAGGDGLRRIAHMYLKNRADKERDSKDPSFTRSLISYGDYFSNKLISIKPTVVLLDFELTKRKPLVKMIDLLVSFTKIHDKKDYIKTELINKGYYHVIGNLYIATTIGALNDAQKQEIIQNNPSNDDNRAIENYFPDDFLNNPYNDGKRCFENAPCLRGKHKPDDFKVVRKFELAKYVQTLTQDKALFKGFQTLLNVFDEIRDDYEKRVLNRIQGNAVNTVNTIYNILDSDYFRRDIEGSNDKKILFKRILNKYLRIN